MVDMADPFVIARFLGQCDHRDDASCWEWRGIMNTNGYGRFSFANRHRLAHRFSFSLFIGSIPSGMVVCHSCDNRKCVNPRHLWVGTQSENLKDAFAKGRHTTPDTRGERNGNRKLDWRRVMAIREMHSEGTKKYLIAQAFGVSPSTIGEIIANEIWKVEP